MDRSLTLISFSILIFANGHIHFCTYTAKRGRYFCKSIKRLFTHIHRVMKAFGIESRSGMIIIAIKCSFYRKYYHVPNYYTLFAWSSSYADVFIRLWFCFFHYFCYCIWSNKSSWKRTTEKKTAEKSRSLNILYKYNDENDTRLENVIKVWKKNALITQTLYLPLLSATFHFYFTFVKLKQMQNCLTKMI